MKRYHAWAYLAAVVLAAPLEAQDTTAGAGAAVVRGVLFHSPTCPHCRDVIELHLPPILRRFGDRLQIMAIDASSRDGYPLYLAAMRALGVPEERYGVPTLVVGTRVLIGSGEIPSELPGIVERGLAGPGIDWPAVPEIRRVIATVATPAPAPAAARGDTAPAAQPIAAPDAATAGAAAKEQTPNPAATGGRDAGVEEPAAPPSRAPQASESAGAPAPPPETHTAAVSPAVPLDPGVSTTTLGRASVVDRFRLDPIGNSASVVVLLFMLAVLARVGYGIVRRSFPFPRAPAWAIPVLAVAGMGIAAYLAYVEVTGTTAVCGPVGDCNTVQQSEYARLFGVIPVGLLGLAGYAAILALWEWQRRAGRARAHPAGLMAWSFTLLATLFSAYLTFLEPFVIGATCAWCLSSAVITALLLLATTSTLLPQDLPRAIVPVAG